MPRRLRALLAPSLLPAGLLLAAPGTALADCMQPAPIEQAVKTADIVFVGTVDDTAQGQRWASVTVEEVWRGPDQPKHVVIKGGPAGNTATSVDRSFEVGVKYIFLPYVDPEGSGLADNTCTNTQPWADEMKAIRPADFRQPLESAAPTSAGFDLGPFVPIVATAVVVFLVLLGVGLVARGRSDA